VVQLRDNDIEERNKNMTFPQQYKEKIYSGVLGKMIGVYLGRPVEAWPYQDIIKRFGEIPYYVHNKLGVPLVVADDDISGTYAFFRAMEDFYYDPSITSKEIGDTWLNYIIENKTILWWGGLGNSTEHTAYLRLKSGINAPESGSIARNGEVLAQQIGAQIFMDAYAMMCPGDPEKAAHYVRQAASVSHDGIAVEAAGFFGAMEAAAFDEKNINKLLDNCSHFIHSPLLRKAVDDTREVCAKHNDWRKVRDWLDKHYGYDLYPGPCHIIPNHTMVLASLLSAEDSFALSVKIAASAAWATDCNAANVGCLNGIRLGLRALDDGPDFRTPVADRAYVITSDGGEGITDAVRETRKIIAAAAALRGEEAIQPKQRFAFEFSGSLQGFQECPYSDPSPTKTFTIQNSNLSGKGDGLEFIFNALAEGVPASVSVSTFLDIKEEYANYETYVSPTIYSGQKITAVLDCEDEPVPTIALYIWYADVHGKLKYISDGATALQGSRNRIDWEVPDTKGMPICRIGLRFESKTRYQGSIVLRKMDWSNTPLRFEQSGALMKDMWDLAPFWAKAFVSSAKNFTPSLKYTYRISHDEDNGVATIGTRDFTDYQVTSTLKFSLHRQGGLVSRSTGHRRYYAAVLREGRYFSIIKRIDGDVKVLGEVPFQYDEFTPYTMSFCVHGNHLHAQIEKITVDCIDTDIHPYLRGGAGFLVDSGTMFIDSFLLEKR